MMKKILFLFVSMLLTFGVHAAQYSLPDNGSTVGSFSTVTARKGDTLNRLAVRHGVGYNEMARANSRWKGRKIPSGTQLTLPTKHKLPKARRSGIVINLADMRLFYYPPGGGKVVTYPVAVGKSGWSTPKGTTKVISKRKNPTWTPPKSIIREAAKKGRKLRKVYPAGPNNPLGTRALRLGMSGYLIHGTNKPWSIGKRVSHGCIRMRKSDIESLYSMVPVNTTVTIVNQRTSLSYPDTPKGKTYARSTEKSKSTKRKSKNTQATRKSKQQPSVAKKQRTYKTEKHTKRSESYVTNEGIDYNRLLRDIETGASQPIDLSGI